jgi:hypothetical protein
MTCDLRSFVDEGCRILSANEQSRRAEQRYAFDGFKLRIAKYPRRKMGEPMKSGSISVAGLGAGALSFKRAIDHFRLSSDNVSTFHSGSRAATSPPNC